MILLIDNYDSFVHNLARYFARLGCEPRVVRNDAISVAQVRALAPAAVVLSPGPCTPLEAGISLELVREIAPRIPILGVCLGHQTIAAAWGGKVIRAHEPVHGRASDVFHGGRGLFERLANPFTACRYHSLVVAEEHLPAELTVTARTADGAVMGIQHRTFPAFGVQFHPESILTSQGYQLLANFLRSAGQPVGEIPCLASEFPVPELRGLGWPDAPITF